MTNSTPLRILVAGEQTDTRLTVCWMLQRAFEPVEILQAVSTREAAECCGEDRIDCVLIDAQATDFNATLDAILSVTGPRLAPVVVLLGPGDEAARLAARQLGVIDWLRKDQISPPVVGLAVQRAIDVASLRLMLVEQGHELERLRSSEADARKLVANLKAAVDRSSEDYQVPEPVRNVVPISGSVEAGSDARSTKDVARPQGERVADKGRSGEPLTAPGLLTDGIGGQSAEDDRLSRRIQKDLMPPGAPYLDGFDVAGLSIPAAATGGDYYDYLPVGDDLLSITIGECSGRGLGPAMMMASLRAYLRVLAANSTDLSTIVSQANTFITQDVGDEEFLITLMLVQIDQFSRSMRCCSAGHQGHLLKRDGEVRILHSTGMPLGLQPETVIPEAEEIRLRSGDAVLLTTDGLQKMVSRSGERFGADRMLELVQRNRDLPARIIIEYLKKACFEFADTAARSDDITIVLVKCSGADRL